MIWMPRIWILIAARRSSLTLCGEENSFRRAVATVRGTITGLSCTSSRVRLGRHFSLNFHISRRHTDSVANRFRRWNDAKNQGNANSMHAVRKRLHSFTSQGCGGVHILWKTRKIKLRFFGRLQKPTGVKGCATLRRRAESDTRHKAKSRVSVSARGVCHGQTEKNPPLYRR